MPKPHPKEFRDDVVAVARRREPGVLLKQIAADFGISESCLRSTGGMALAQPTRQSVDPRQSDALPMVWPLPGVS